jgi:hypothetical protein
MLNKKYLPYLTAIISFFLAWFIKPFSVTVQKNELNNKEITQKTSSKDITLLNDEAPKKAIIRKSNDEIEITNIPEPVLKARAQLSSSLRMGFAMQDAAYVTRLAEIIGLTPDQRQQFIIFLQEKREELNIYRADRKIKPQDVPDHIDRVEKTFNDSLSEILSSEQIIKLNEYAKKRKENSTIANAQREFADLIDKVDLTSEQRKAAQEAFSQSATQKNTSELKSNVFLESFDTLGFGKAGKEMATQQINDSKISAATDPGEEMRRYVENRRIETNSKIEIMRPILSAGQLEQYKATLQARDQTYLSNMGQHVQPPAPKMDLIPLPIK